MPVTSSLCNFQYASTNNEELIEMSEDAGRWETYDTQCLCRVLLFKQRMSWCLLSFAGVTVSWTSHHFYRICVTGDNEICLLAQGPEASTIGRYAGVTKCQVCVFATVTLVMLAVDITLPKCDLQLNLWSAWFRCWIIKCMRCCLFMK